MHVGPFHGEVMDAVECTALHGSRAPGLHGMMQR